MLGSSPTVANTIVIAVQLALGALAFTMFALLPPTDRHIARFAATYEVAVTSSNRALLSSAIRWSRAWRLGGGALALVVIEVVQQVTGRGSGSALFAVAIGYSLGASLGEALRPRPTIAATRRASLRRRRARDYVRPWVPRTTVTMGALAVLATARYGYLARDGVEPVQFAWMPAPSVLAGSVAAAVVVVGLQLGAATLLARRPEPTDAADVDAAHHAVRSAAIVSINGCALLMASLAASFAMTRVSWQATGRHDVWSVLHGAAHIVSSLGALVGLTLSMRSIPRFFPIDRARVNRSAAPT